MCRQAAPPAPAPTEPEATAGEQEPVAEPAAKRQRVEETQDPGPAAAGRQQPATAAAGECDDALAQALGRIAAHIGKRVRAGLAASCAQRL